MTSQPYVASDPADDSEHCCSDFFVPCLGGNSSDAISINRWDTSCLTPSKSYGNDGIKNSIFFSVSWSEDAMCQWNQSMPQMKFRAQSLYCFIFVTVFGTRSSCIDICS